jgi:hypothetical protein
MGPKDPRGVWFGFPGPLGNVPATFLFYPIAAILPKDLQTPPQGAKMGRLLGISDSLSTARQGPGLIALDTKPEGINEVKQREHNSDHL